MRLIKLTWEIDDGYAGYRPHQLNISEDDISMDWDEWDKLTKEEREVILYDIVKSDFEEKISYHISKTEDSENSNN